MFFDRLENRLYLRECWIDASRPAPDRSGACPPGRLCLVLRLTVPGGSLNRPRQPSSGPEPEVAPHAAREWGAKAVLRPARTPSASRGSHGGVPLAFAACSTPTRVCTRLSRGPSAAPPALQALLYQGSASAAAGLTQSPRQLCSLSPPACASAPSRQAQASPSRRRRPSPDPSCLSPAVRASRGRWKRPFDFPIPRENSPMCTVALQSMLKRWTPPAAVASASFF